MKAESMKAMTRGCLACVLGFALAGQALAQEPKSAALAKALAAALDAAKVDSIAAKDPSSPDTFVAALYFPGLQLLTVSAAYTAPMLLEARLEKREYRDVYIDLNSAGTPASKIFVEDLMIDGLHPRRDGDRPFDSYDVAGKRTSFDGEWRDQKLSEQEYMKLFTAADERYSQMLQALLAQIKRGF
jgi:hypothetical protein